MEIEGPLWPRMPSAITSVTTSRYAFSRTESACILQFAADRSFARRKDNDGERCIVPFEHAGRLWTQRITAPVKPS